MASIEEILVSAATGDATVSGIVSGRVYFMHAPQGAALPRLIYQRVSTGERPQGMGRDVPIDRGRYQFTAQAATPTEARDLADAVESLFEQFTASGPPAVTHSRLLNAVDIPTGSRPAAGSERRLYARAVDIQFTFRRD